jgi:squalene-hopene/tetraprenyl-beta-curcumene cyclase
LEGSILRSCEALLARQDEQGAWCFELEADCTIPAEYILMMHFMDEIDTALQERIAIYLRDHQADHGGWPLYYAGELDPSATVKCYWALKLAGDDPEDEHMRRAREAILERGGAARCNVFTRIAMALFGHVPWRATPMVPVEIMLLPRWFPFHLRKVSYWTRTVVVPLSILCSLKARAKNPTGIGIRELFSVDPERERDWFTARSGLNRLFLGLERSARLFEPLIPRFIRRRAMQRALDWVDRRLNGTDGLGGIFPAMVNAYEAYDRLGIPADDQRPTRARAALQRLLVHQGDWSTCSPCFSPVWDTALASLALQEADSTPAGPLADGRVARAVERAYAWLESVQVLDGPADWRTEKPGLAPGGWAFQYRNPYYPDLDDTAAVVWGMALKDAARHAEAIRRATDWLAGMQSKNGGFGAFDADNDSECLNEIPFADHGALLDPPTADVSARCALVFALLGRAQDAPALERVLQYLYGQQEVNGAWYGRWGTK